MKRAGFTMIELIFVIVILGILAAVAVPQLSETKKTAQDNADATDKVTCIKGAKVAHFNGTTEALVKDLPGCADSNLTAYNESNATITFGSAAPLPL